MEPTFTLLWTIANLKSEEREIEKERGMKRKVMRVVLSIGRRGNMCFLEE
jgi:hypothetical protein